MPDGAVGVLIPAYRARATIGSLVEAMKSRYPTVPILVVDDGSGDGTDSAARAAGAEVLVQSVNGGKGTALSCGFAMASEMGWDWAVAMDADGQHPPEDVEQFLSHLPAADCGLVVGARELRPCSMPWPRVCSNRLTTFLLEIQAGCRLWDSQCGFRMYRMAAVRAARLPVTGRFEWESGALVRVARSGWGVERVGVSTVYNDAGSHIRPWRDTARFVRLWFGLWRWLLSTRGSAR
jgi:glycosyltransferase involved in cell wall biosynthesis